MKWLQTREINDWKVLRKISKCLEAVVFGCSPDKKFKNKITDKKFPKKCPCKS